MKRFRTFVLILLGLAAVYFVAVASGIPQAFFPALSALFTLLFPLLIGGWFARRFRLGWGLFGAGVLTFIASQVFHIPFNLYLLNPFIQSLRLEVTSGGWELVIYGVLLGLSAGVFEEAARYITLRFWRKDARTWGQSLMLGAGHGGIEAILVGAYGFYILVQMVMMHGMDVDAVAGLAGANRAQEIFNFVAGYWGSSWYDFFWSALERVSAFTFHLSASVLVYQSVKRKNLLWLLYAILWHTLLDALAVYGAVSWGVAATEGALFIIGLLSIGIIFALRETLAEPEEIIEEEPALSVLPEHELPELSITSKDLDESRYD